MDKINQMTEDIKSLRIQGANNIALAVLDGLESQAKELMTEKQTDAEKYLLEIGEKLAYARPTEPLAQNAIRYIFLRENQTANFYLQKISEYRQKLHSAIQIIERSNIDAIKDGGTYLTHCHSSTVISLFTKAWKDGKRFRVYVTETRPKFQGRKTAKELVEAGIDDVTFIIDDVAPQLIASKEKCIDAVFIGADMLSEKGFVNKVGSFGIAIACRIENIPLYSITTLLKYDSRPFSFSFIEKRKSSEVWENPPSGLRFYTPAFDYIPYETYIKIICEKGEIRGDEATSSAYSLYPFLTNV